MNSLTHTLPRNFEGYKYYHTLKMWHDTGLASSIYLLSTLLLFASPAPFRWQVHAWKIREIGNKHCLLILSPFSSVYVFMPINRTSKMFWAKRAISWTQSTCFYAIASFTLSFTYVYQLPNQNISPFLLSFGQNLAHFHFSMTQWYTTGIVKVAGLH